MGTTIPQESNMKTINIKASTLHAVPREQWGAYVVASVGGTDDVYVFNGHDIHKMYKEDHPDHKTVTLLELLRWNTADTSGNAHEILCIVDGSITKLQIV